MKKTPLFASTLIAASFALSVPAYAASVTWTGSVNSTWDTNTANWSGDSTTFTNNDNVTFNGSGTGTITISGEITAGTMTVSSGNYTFSTSGSNTLTVNEIDMNGGSVTFDGSATIGTFYTAKDGGTDDTITLTTGTTLKVGTLTNNWGSNFVLNEGSVLETDSATFATYHTDTVTGSGTWKAGTFTFANWATSTFDGITLEVTDMVVGSNSQAAYITISGGTATIDTLSLNNSSSITFSNSGTYTVGTVGASNSEDNKISVGSGTTVGITSITMSNYGKLTLTGEGTFNIGTYQQEDWYTSAGTSLAIGDNTTVNVETFSVSWHQDTTTLGEGAVLTITKELSVHTADNDKFSGGTINAEKLNIYNASTIASFSDTNLNIGSGGIVNTGSSGYFGFGDSLTVGVYAGANGGNTSWNTSAEIQFTGTDNTGTTFSTNAGETITLGGEISGVGFTNTGSGTLVLSGTVALSDVIINSGNITIDGATLVLDNLEAIYESGMGYYEIIAGSGGSSSVTYTGDITFSYRGSELEGWSIAIDTSTGNVWVYGEVGMLTWNGTEGNNTWNTTNTNWVVGDTASSFSANDNVVFDSTAGYKIVDITENVNPDSITVEDSYTFTTSVTGGVTVDAGGSLTVTSGATLTIDSGVTVYIDHEESAFSVEGKIAGTGTIEFDFTGSSTSDYGSTINLGEGNEFAGTVYIHSGYFDLTGSNIGNGTYEVADGVNFQADGNTTTTVSNNIVFDGTSQLHVNSGGTLNISGTVTGDGTLDKRGAGTLNISGEVGLTGFSMSDSASTATFSGGGSIGTVTINLGATLVFSGEGKTYTITTITKTNSNNAGTLEVDAGTTVNVGTLNGDWHIGTIKVDGILNISGTAEFGSGSGNTETFTGTGTVTVGTLQVGHGSNDSNGATVKIDGGLTFIADSITTGKITNDSHIQLGNATFGTSNADGLTFASTVTEVTLTASGGEKTTFNTSVYDVAEGKFTDTSTTITIGVSVVGGGNIAVTGNGTLALSGTSTLGSVTVDSGATLDLSSGTVTVGSSIQNSGKIVVNSDTVFVLDNLTGTTDGNSTTYVIITNSGGEITGWSDLTADNFSFSDGTTITSVTITTDGQVTVSTNIKDLIWNGSTSGTWDTTSENWVVSGSSENSTFSNGDRVTFTGSEGDAKKTVTVQDAGVIAGSVTVEGGTYSFAGSNTGSQDNKDKSIITVNGTFTIASGAEVDLDGAVVYADFVVNGTLKLDIAAGGDGTWSTGQYGEIHGTITINNGGWVELDTGDATGYNDGGGVTAITINAGGTLYVGTTSNQTLGGCTLTLVGGTITGVEGSNMDLFHGDSKLVALAEEGADAENPTVSTVENVMLTPRSNDYASGNPPTEVQVAENAVLLVKSGFWAGPQDGSIYNCDLEKTGAGTLEVSGIFALNTGNLIISEGTVILSGTVGYTGSGAGTTEYTLGFASSVSVASDASLNMCFAEDTSLSGVTFSGEGTIEKSGEYKLTIDGYTFGGTTTVSEGTLVLTGSTEVIDVHVTNGATLDLRSASKAGSNGNGSLYIDGGTVIVSSMTWGSGSNFGANMNNCYLQISNGGVLEVTAAQAADTAGRRGFAIMEGEGTYRYSGEGTSYIAANETNQNIHVADGATLIFDVVNEDATLEVSKLIAKSYNGDTPEYTTGSLVKIGAGTVILSNESNLYSGGTTIKEGVLVAASSGALGTGTVSIDGGQLSINSDVTITNDIGVTLSETYLVTDTSISPTSLGSGTLEPYAAGDTDDGIYAITGTGSLGSSGSQVTITLFIDDTIAELLAEAGETGLGFYLLDETIVDSTYGTTFTVSLSDALSSYTATYDATTGIVWIVGAAAPEPSMFGMIFGLSALGLVATRRRRRKVA